MVWDFLRPTARGGGYHSMLIEAADSMGVGEGTKAITDRGYSLSRCGCANHGEYYSVKSVKSAYG